MNNTFSLHRIFLYARKHYMENIRSYIYGLLALLIINSIYVLIFTKQPYREEELTNLLLMAFMFYFIRISCRDSFKQEPMYLSYTLPVTALEKYLFIWFNSTIVVSALYCLVQWPFVVITNSTEYHILNLFYGQWLLILYIQATALLSYCWIKGSPVKVFLALLGATFLFYAVYYKGIQIATGLNTTIPFSSFHTAENSDKAQLIYTFPEQMSRHTAYAIILDFWILIFWLTGYFKFRERTLK